MKSNHSAIAIEQAKVKAETKRLRVLVPPYDDKAADVYGCLQDAAQHFHGAQGENDLIIASAFVNNIAVDVTSDLNLSHAHVRGIYRICQQAQVCDTHDKQWKDAFIRLGASQDVKFYDAQQSAILPPLF